MSKKIKGEVRISFFNWFVTLIVSLIPAVNILFFIITMAAARTRAKRRFAAAALVLTMLLLAAAAIMLFFMSDRIIEWCNTVLAEAPAA